MTWFATDELISSTKLVRNFSSVLWKLKNNEKSKFWILKNNEVEAVIISKEEYRIFEELQEYIEDLEDAKMVEERMKNDNWTYYSLEEMAKIQNIDLNKI